MHKKLRGVIKNKLKKIYIYWPLYLLLFSLLMIYSIDPLFNLLIQNPTQKNIQNYYECGIFFIYTYFLSCFELALRGSVKTFISIKIIRRDNFMSNLYKWSSQPQFIDDKLNYILGNSKSQKNVFKNIRLIREKIVSFKYNEPENYADLKIYLKIIKNSNSHLAFFNILNAIIGGIFLRILIEPMLLFKIVSRLNDILGVDTLLSNIEDYVINTDWINYYSYYAMFYIVLRVIMVTFNRFNNFKINLFIEMMEDIDKNTSNSIYEKIPIVRRKNRRLIKRIK